MMARAAQQRRASESLLQGMPVRSLGSFALLLVICIVSLLFCSACAQSDIEDIDINEVDFLPIEEADWVAVEGADGLGDLAALLSVPSDALDVSYRINETAACAEVCFSLLDGDDTGDNDAGAGTWDTEDGQTRAVWTCCVRVARTDTLLNVSGQRIEEGKLTSKSAATRAVPYHYEWVEGGPGLSIWYDSTLGCSFSVFVDEALDSSPLVPLTKTTIAGAHESH